MAKAADLEPAPQVLVVRALTVAKVDSMGLVVRRWTQCSAGKSEAQELASVVDQTGDCHGVNGRVDLFEAVHLIVSRCPVGRIHERVEMVLGRALQPLGQFVEHVGWLGLPAESLLGGGEHLGQGVPETDGAIADSQDRR